MTEARQAAQQMTDNPMWMRGLLQACLNNAPAAEVHRQAELAQNELIAQQNSDLKYYQGAVLATCGEKQIAYAFLQKAVDGRYCAHEALLADPLLAPVRKDSEFQAILQSAAQCEQKFISAEGLRK